LTFGNWFQNGYKGTRPDISNWETHLGTLFPHLRLRDFLEIRHIDAQPFEHTLAPVAFFLALSKCKKVRNDVWSLLKSYNIDFKEIFNSKSAQIDYSFLYNPLLDFAVNILDQYKEYEGIKALEAFKKFVTKKQNYWDAASAKDFVLEKKTNTPSLEFLKNLK
jgi:gamma-glutamylcysteine synthetase